MSKKSIKVIFSKIIFSYTNIKTHDNDGYSTEIDIKIKNKVLNLSEKIKKHPALNHEFFEYLNEQSKVGFNPIQYEIYYLNFAARTLFTIPTVSNVIKKAAEYGDNYAVVNMMTNLNDEAGYGNEDKMHPELLLKCHNQHGLKIFGLNPLNKLKDALKSKFVLQETRDYIKAKKNVFKSKSYPWVIGDSLAHELAADSMLDNFRKAFFEPYKNYYTQNEYDKLIAFYKAHKDDTIKNGDVQQEHGRIATQIVESLLAQKKGKNMGQIEKGAIAFLDHQKQVWSAILNRMQQEKYNGIPIPLKSSSIKYPKLIQQLTSSKYLSQSL